MQQPSIEAGQEFHVGQTVELQASLCRTMCEPDCQCRDIAARNGHQGAVLAVHPTLFDDESNYDIDGLPFQVFGADLRTVES